MPEQASSVLAFMFRIRDIFGHWLIVGQVVSGYKTNILKDYENPIV